MAQQLDGNSASVSGCTDWPSSRTQTGGSFHCHTERLLSISLVFSSCFCAIMLAFCPHQGYCLVVFLIPVGHLPRIWKGYNPWPSVQNKPITSPCLSWAKSIDWGYFGGFLTCSFQPAQNPANFNFPVQHTYYPTVFNPDSFTLPRQGSGLFYWDDFQFIVF